MQRERQEELPEELELKRCWQGSEAGGHSRAEARLKQHWRDGRAAGMPLIPLPDKREETQGSQDAIERDVGDEITQVVADGPGQVLGGERENTRHHFAHLG